MKILYALLTLLLVAGAGEWHGHSRGFDDGVLSIQQDAIAKIASAQADTERAKAERDAVKQTLANVQAQLDAKKRALETANYYATAAMAARNALQKQLTAATAARADALRKAAHDSPDCADLARLPVCPAVAERLWGYPVNVPASAGH